MLPIVIGLLPGVADRHGDRVAGESVLAEVHHLRRPAAADPAAGRRASAGRSGPSARVGAVFGGGVGILYAVTTISGPPLAVLLSNQGLAKKDFRRRNRLARQPRGIDHSHPRGTPIAALLGGVTNGLVGAWGPVVTPYLLNRAVRPRFAIGSVNTAEVAVASASAFTLIGSLGVAGVDGRVLLSMLAGGVVAAPLAAWVIRYVPARPMGIAVAILLLVTNAPQSVSWAGFTLGPLSGAAYAATIALVVLAVHSARRSLASR